MHVFEAMPISVSYSLVKGCIFYFINFLLFHQMVAPPKL